MKLLKKVGVTIAGFFISLKILAMKVYAQTTFNAMSAADYGIEPLEPVTTEESIIAVVAKIFGAIIVPVALLVGIIVYFIKGKSEVWKKILITIGIVVIYIAFAVIINNI